MDHHSGNSETHCASFKENDFNSFVSVRFSTPIKQAIVIPKTDGTLRWERENVMGTS